VFVALFINKKIINSSAGLMIPSFENDRWMELPNTTSSEKKLIEIGSTWNFSITSKRSIS
jgi:hypothetical protein